MNRKSGIAIVGLCLCAFILCLWSRYRESGELSENFYVAADPQETPLARQDAAARLNNNERAIIRKMLVRCLQGDSDKSMYDAILVLGIVGDASTIPLLEAIKKEIGPRAPGRLNAAINDSIDQIKNRSNTSWYSRW